MANELKGKVAIVTGAAFGIGHATALLFAREGARVVVSDLVDDAGEKTAGEIKSAGGDARYAHCDISKPDQVRGLIEGTVQAWGRVDIAFNNAGIEGTLAPLGELTEEAFAKVIAVNLTGAFFCMKYELAQMAKQGSGVIVNNASILGQVGFATAGAYTAAKHGLIGLTQTAALEYATKGIRINAVCPGFVLTPMVERAGFADGSARKTIEGLHPIKRLGRPEEIAEAVLFLSSDRSSFITGHPLLVDGGYVAQ